MRSLTSHWSRVLLNCVVVAGLLLAGCSAGVSSGVKPADDAVHAKEIHPGTTYLIGPGDKLQVFVWGNPELSTNVPVRPDGRITTPLVEDVVASGKTSTELAREMEQQLARYIKNPVVTVTVTDFVGRFSEQIRVVGQAAKPQSIPYREKLTLLDVMIAVGGLTEFAAGNRATVVRPNSGAEQQLQVRLDDLMDKGDISANIDMLPGDIVIIPEAWF